MKLSVVKKPGWMHVTGGRLLEVATPHAVPASGLSAYADDPETDRFRAKDAPPPRPRPKDGLVRCEEGDIAIEILFAKTGRLAGHSYLTGPAINLNRYCAAETPGWFRDEPLAGAMIDDVTMPTDEETPIGELWEALVRRRAPARFGPAAIYAVDIVTGDNDPEHAAKVVDMLAHAWKHV